MSEREKWGEGWEVNRGSRAWIDAPPRTYSSPDGQTFTEDCPDPLVDEVDRHTCRLCGTPVGWWVDADDDGRTIGGFRGYGISADRRRRWCEDCFPTAPERTTQRRSD